MQEAGPRAEGREAPDGANKTRNPECKGGYQPPLLFCA